MVLIPSNKKLRINVYGRSFVVTAVADNDQDANNHMERFTDQAVIAVSAGLVIMASIHDQGVSQ